MYSCVCALPEDQPWKHYLKNNHLSTLSNLFCSFCKRDKLTRPQAFLNRRHFSSLIVCCWSALVRSDVCTADFGTTLVTFSPREKPNCVILDLSRPLLHRYEPCWLFPSLGCSSETFGKDVSPLWFPLASVAILSLPLLLLLFFLALSLLMPRFHFFLFVLCVNWYCWCYVKVMNFPIGLWVFLPDLADFLWPISSCQPRLSTIQDPCTLWPICLCPSYSVNPAFFLSFHQIWALWY